jgi:hypothetical protein
VTGHGLGIPNGLEKRSVVTVDSHVRHSEESCIRKAVDERSFIPGSVGLADTTAEDEAATGTAFALM